MSESVLERATRAVNELRDCEVDHPTAYVRAVLLAIREPDGRMQQAAWKVEPSWNKSVAIYQVMLDSILSGK